MTTEAAAPRAATRGAGRAPTDPSRVTVVYPGRRPDPARDAATDLTKPADGAGGR